MDAAGGAAILGAWLAASRGGEIYQHTERAMREHCDQCGADWPEGESCDGYFGLCLAEEQGQPDLYAVHHLIVPAFMLQHNRYSRTGWLEAHRLLGQMLEGLTWAEARQQITRDQREQKISLIKGPKLDGVDAITWSETIAAVRLDSAEHYCADVRRWAASVWADSAPLVERA
jgi:hypothetical protein